MATALLCGRFHALTRAQGEAILALGRDAGVDAVVVVIASADHAGTRRNPLPVALRRAQLAPVLAALGKPWAMAEVADQPDDADWVRSVVAAATGTCGHLLSTENTTVVTANHDVLGLFVDAGFRTARLDAGSLLPSQLLTLAATGGEWRSLAAPSTVAALDDRVLATLRTIYGDHKRTDDGELAAHRDFDSYGAQMDASLRQKLDDLLPWVVPGRIVDKGCGTGKLMVELSRRFPSTALVGVDLSRELLHRCDENTYFTGDVRLVLADAADVAVERGTATTVIFSSIMHEIYTYSGYDQAQVNKAVASAASELGPGGRILIRDGISPTPPAARWRLRLLTDEARRAFGHFAVEFKHGEGAPSERLSPERVELSAHLANEFLCKKDYRTNWHIEVHEEYGARTLDGWRAVLTGAGLRVLEAREYANDWIVAHRYVGQVELTDDEDRPLPWPATNAVVVAEK